MISNCSISENGTAYGKAGDQTGREWYITDWYKHSKGWNVVLRPPTRAIGRGMADNARKAAQNPHNGYSQAGDWSTGRTSFWRHLEASDYDASKITVDNNSDCSSSTAGLTKAEGYRQNNEKLKKIDINLTTWGMEDAYVKAGFTALRESKYLNSPDYLQAGDVILRIDAHVVINLDDGKYAGGDDPKPETYMRESIEYGSSNKTVKELQSCLNVLGYKGKDGKELELDGKFGENTDYATKKFQDDYDLGPDGKVSKTGVTWKTIDRLVDQKGLHPYIEPGMTGKSVYQMQWKLNKLGYRGADGNKLEVDADYGDNTKYAICAIQDDFNFGPDGKCYPTGYTWNKVDDLLNHVHSVKVTAPNGLNVRRWRGAEYSVITTIAYGSSHVATNSVGDWTYLSDMGGWVSDEWIA